MPVTDPAALVASLDDEVADDLRTVATYDRDGYDVLYVRGDVESLLDQIAEEVHDELVIQGIGRDYLEGLFQAGDLQCAMHRFDRVTVFHFADADYRGLFVSLDTDADFSMHALADTCKEHLAG